ncbi:MAG: hypothetical protein H7Y38_03530 [Armatimonadetes bacterium]|nr:hypothetical protein [Armatimonadota bacterium]
MEPEPTASNDTPTSTSRRDFLRRASKQAAQEAMEIGSKVVPGAALAQRFLAEKREENGEPDDDALALDLSQPPGMVVPEPPAPSPLTNPLGWLAAWRKRRE